MAVSDMVVYIMGAHQGTVLSQFSDDTAIVGCVSEENEQEYSILDIVDRCQQNHLILNINKTKELVIDFQRKSSPHRPVNI